MRLWNCVELLESRRLLSAGDLDPTFGTGGFVFADLPGSTSEYGWSVVVQNDGKVVAAGQRQLFADPLGDFLVARYNADGSLDTGFGGGDGVATIDFDGRHDFAYAVAIAPGNKIVVAGYSAADNTQADSDFAVARLTPDGALDTTFGADGTGKVVVDFWGGTDYAWDVAARPDGGVVAAGYSQSGSGASRTSNIVVAALDPDGTLDADFNGSGMVYTTVGVNSAAFAVALDSLQRVVVGGTASLVANDQDFVAVRYLPDGSQDATFSDDGVATMSFASLFGATRDLARDVAVHLNDDIVLVGETTGSSGYTDFALASFNGRDGRPDITFGGGDGKTSIDFGGGVPSARTNDSAVSVSILPGADMLVVGTSTHATTGAETPAFAKIDWLGNLKPDFDGDGRVTNGRGIVFDAATAPGGKIVTLGLGSIDVGSYPDFVVARRTADGQFDPTFGAGGADGDGVVTTDFTGSSLDTILHVLPLPGGKTLALGGHWTGLGTGMDVLLARFNADGSPDASFGPAASNGLVVLRTVGRDEAHGLALQSDGKILIAGYRDDTKVVVSRFTADGLPDATYGTGGEAVITALETFPVIDSLDLGFAVQADDKVLVAPTVRRTGREYFAVARLLPTGAPDPSFGGGDGAVLVLVNDATPSAVAMAPDGKIVVAGPQYVDRGVAVLRLKPDGAIDETFSADGRALADWGVGTEMTVADVVVDAATGSILVGGSMTPSGSSSTVRSDFALVKFLADGSLDAAYGDGGKVRTDFFAEDDFIADLLPMPDGSVIALGTARRPGDDGTGTDRDFALARYTADGTLDAGFGPSFDGKVITDVGGRTDWAGAGALDGDGRIVVGGTAPVAGRSLDAALARYEGVLSGPVVEQVTVGNAAWGAQFLSGLGASELRGKTSAGAGSAGYRLLAEPSEGAAPPLLPWINLDTITVRFLGPVDTTPIRPDTAHLRGEGGTEYPLRDFAFDAATRTATWKVASPPAADRLVLEVDVDGDSDYEFRRLFNVLGGDADRGGAVNALDLADVKRRLGRSQGDGVAGNGGYSVFADVTGDGRVNALDLAAVKQRLGRRLPAAAPAPIAAGAGDSTGAASVTRELFGSSLIL